MENVTDQPPEGEPDNVTPEQAALEREIEGLDDADDFFVIGGTRPAEVIHFDAGRLDQYAACGYDLDRNGPEGWTTDRGKVTCAECAATLVDEQLAEGDEDDPGFLKPAPGCGHPMPQGADCCIATPAPLDVEPEPRTVSLEVLTDELLALAAVEYVGADADLLTRAKVGIVGRIGGRADAVTDVDRDWHASSGADVLANLIRQAQGRAFNASAELLMPTADVLAVLDGHADARLLTAPVHVLALDINEGMFLVGPAGGDGEELREVSSPSLGCALPDCENGAVCVVLVVGGVELHRNGYERVLVRVPASVTR